MSDTVFRTTTADLRSLIADIESGAIGLPDIQRPFVWPNQKVRDLFDSMYRGYPVGYLLFWKNGLRGDRTIGRGAGRRALDTRPRAPEMVIVDGQQRLTSLYAVIKGVPVVDKNWVQRTIRIAFNPLEERFEVADAAIRRDKAFIADISVIWTDSIFTVANDYLDGLTATRSVDGETVSRVQQAIQRLHSLEQFHFTVLELDANVSEEAVSDVFVRINSEGTPLNQADFVLTLMSVFREDARKQLEKFCRSAKQQDTSPLSPYNHFIQPSPDQLLRVSVGVAFKRARLQYVYSILRGKDLETGRFSEALRVAQFDKLQRAQEQALEITCWHDFMHCLRTAGFRSGKMISSTNNLLFSYVLYLIGRNEHGVEKDVLRKIIAQWFFMSAVTGRFTGSPESAMEFDLARLRDARDATSFVDILRRICGIALTHDFWKVTLPNDLATSSPRSPSLHAYNAALVLLDAPVLFSPAKMVDVLDPDTPSDRRVERRHLYAKPHLAALGVSGTRSTNQIANYAYMEDATHAKLSAGAPADSVPGMVQEIEHEDLERMHYFHALPEGWERMKYAAFLEKRRELIAQVVNDGYNALAQGMDVRAGQGEDGVEKGDDLEKMIELGESDGVEFKSTLRTNLHTGRRDERVQLAVLKTLAAFLNTNGGKLVIGVADDGTPVGIAEDGFANEDKFNLHLVNLVNDRMGPEAMLEMHPHFEDYEGARVLIVRCPRSSRPVYVKDGRSDRFYVRTGPSSRELTAKETVSYVTSRFSR